MKCWCILLLALTPTLQLQAVSAGFGLDAFNRVVSASAKGSAVFSPVAFDLDCVIFSEAFDPLVRAKFAEKMGVMNGLENVYKPIYERLSSAGDQGLEFFSAHAFCVSDERYSNVAYRKWLQDSFSAEILRSDHSKGVECWFRAKTNGYMEAFEFPASASTGGCYSFYNLVTVRCCWKDPFPTNNTRDIRFHLDEGSSSLVKAMCDLRMADVWEKKDETIVRLELTDGAWLFAMVPNEKVAFRDIRNSLTSLTILDLVSGIKSLTEPGVSHGPVAIVLPRIDITTESDLKPPMGYYRLPLTGMTRLPSDLRPKLLRQRTRFILNEWCVVSGPLDEKQPCEEIRATPETKKIILNRPFLFFVYHEPTGTIPIVGQFTGK